MKYLKFEKNSAGGYDIVTERDSGNKVRILTGSPEFSYAYLKRLRDGCDEAMSELRNIEVVNVV